MCCKEYNSPELLRSRERNNQLQLLFLSKELKLNVRSLLCLKPKDGYDY